MLVVEQIDGVHPGESEWRELLRECGFVPDYRGWVLDGARRGA